MNGTWGPGMVTAGLTVSAALFFLDLWLSVALLSSNYLTRVTVRRMSSEAGDRLRFLEELKIPPSSYRMAAYLARQISLVGGSIAASLTARGVGWSHPWLLGLAIGVVVGVLLLETLAARGLAHRDPEAALRLTAPAVRAVHSVAYPFVMPLRALLRRAARPVSPTDEEREEDQEEEVEAYIEVGEREGILEADEGKMMRSIIYLGDTRVREIMTPRTDVVAIPAHLSVEGTRRAVVEAGHARYPVYRDHIDNIVGILHVHDLVRAWEEGNDRAPISAYVRPAFFVPETRSVAELLAEMRIRTHISLVVDEYGGIAGLVTLEDLLEEIVGDIRDENDVEEVEVQEEANGSWLVSGLAHVERIEELFGLDIGERDFDTVGGLVVAELGRVPSEGETLETRGLRIEVIQADPRRVYRVRVRRADRAGSIGAAP